MAAFPSITQTGEGELLLVFRRAPDSRWLLKAKIDSDSISTEKVEALQEQLYHWDGHSQLACIKFDQELNAISDLWCMSSDGQSADQDASLLLLESGEILLASFSWYAMPPAFADLARAWGGKAYGGPKNTGCSYIPWGSYTRRSSDSGQGWSEREYLPPLPGDVDLVPGLRTSHGGGCRGQMVSQQSEILLASYAQIDELGPHHSAHLYVSSDDGKSYSHRCTIAVSSEYGLYEPSLCVLEDGTLLCWLRTSHSEDRIASVRSTDGGRSFGELELHEAVGHPCHPLVLKSGEVLLTYGYRHEGMGVRARMLDRQGRGVDSAQEIVLRSDGACTDLGYPWATELEDGRVLICYYFTGEEGVRHIAYSLLQRS